MGAGLSARARALGALGRILWRGVVPGDAWIAGVPELAAAVAAVGDADALAAEHHRVMIREVPACASVFRSDDALMGGDHAAAAAAAFRAAGFEPPDPPDQIGALIGLYAGLLEHEPDAAAGFAAAHLGPWAGLALGAIARQGGPLYPRVAEAAAGLLGDAVFGEVAGTDPPEGGLGELAEWLATPARCGWYFSPSDIARMAVETGLPCGFASRRQMLHTWLVTAAQHGAAPAALQALRACQVHGIAQLAASFADFLDQDRN